LCKEKGSRKLPVLNVPSFTSGLSSEKVKRGRGHACTEEGRRVKRLCNNFHLGGKFREHGRGKTVIKEG